MLHTIMRSRAHVPPAPSAQKRRPYPEGREAGIQAGVAALASWAGEHAKELKVVAQRRDADGAMADRALEIVRKFIVERGLILFGGLAIDYALRLRGQSLYPEDERPDFDVLSPRSVDDAYDLADILSSAGFEMVGVVRGIHVQTMRVRTDFVWVADIGYAPAAVFSRIPTLELRGMRFVHPTFQRMDMHLAFCFPFNGPPHEDVFHRWRKDLERFNRLEGLYPLDRVSLPAGEALRVVRAQSAAAVVCERGARCAVALHGFAAYALLRGALEELAAAPAFAHLVPAGRERIPSLALVFPDAHSFAVEVPDGVAALAHVAGPDPASIVGDRPAQWFEPYMDLCPESVQAGPLVVRSTKGRLLATTPIRVRLGDETKGAPGTPETSGADLDVNIVTPQYLLLHFLYEAHRADGVARETYLAYYAHTLEILRAAEEAYAAWGRELGEGPGVSGTALAEFAASPFAPMVHTMGEANTNSAYVIKIATWAAKLQDSPPAALHLDPGIASFLEGLPANYYPASGKARPSFDYSRSPLFRRAGERRP